MNVQAEVSLYPLRTRRIGGPIDRFVAALERPGLTVRPGNMSTGLSGDVGAVFSAVAEAFAEVAAGGEVALVLKASNACPQGGAATQTGSDSGHVGSDGRGGGARENERRSPWPPTR